MFLSVGRSFTIEVKCDPVDALSVVFKRPSAWTGTEVEFNCVVADGGSRSAEAVVIIEITTKNRSILLKQNATKLAM
uniref:Uncharacterized protein n=1 Tax=Anguilla anguilla TaxID=7936 RepID=A0A0E9WCS4_ANGAN